MAETAPDVAPPGTRAGAGAGADLIARAARASNEEVRSNLDEAFRAKAAAEAVIVTYLSESDRREVFRDDGATSTEAWVAERFGLSVATARGLTRLATKAWDLPTLVGSLRAGEISLDKVRAVADVATPETERELCDRAKECTVRELADVVQTAVAKANTEAARSPGSTGSTVSAGAARYLRLNHEYRTVTAQLPADSYAEVRSVLEARAEGVPSTGQTPWDQRLCDGFMELIHASAAGAAEGTTGAVSPHVVVVHVPLEALVDDSVEPTELAGELEKDGLIDCATVQRIACDATLAVAIDDDVGHTMYEGRARRFPTQSQRREVFRRDRHCRFPGCTNMTFAEVHHIKPWKPGGQTDLDNLALLCLHHHRGVVHREGWSMTGNANEELEFVGPTGRVMTSRPSPLWTRVTDGRRAENGQRAANRATSGHASGHPKPAA